MKCFVTGKIKLKSNLSFQNGIGRQFIFSLEMLWPTEKLYKFKASALLQCFIFFNSMGWKKIALRNAIMET